MILDLIEWRAAETPQRPALWFNGRELSYLDLELRARRLAHRLRELGVKRGDRVAVLALNHPVHVDLLLAAPKLGIVCAPLNYRLGDAELRAAVDRIKPATIFVDSRHQALAEHFGYPWTRLSDYGDWLAVGQETPITPQGGPLTENDAHLLLFTGGSTGIPKAAVLPYRQTIGNAIGTAKAWGITDGDCAIQCTPCFHAALNVLTLPLFVAGGRVVLMSRFAADEYLALAEQHAASLMFMVPTMYQALGAHPAFETASISRVRWAISGGAPCPAPVRWAFARRGIAFKQGYGLTEVGVNCFSIDIEEATRKPEAVGRPLPEVQAVIRRPDGSACAPGEAGELTLAGPYLFSGYFEDPVETANALREGWFWTGDLLRQDEDGLFSVCGRRKEMYISGGENVYPVEVENALSQCYGVVECAVFGWPDGHWGERGIAVVALQEGAARDAEALSTELRTRLAGYKVPSEFLFLPELPKTGTDKVDRVQTRRLYEAQREARTGVDA
jgi:fatty-acyl-CoA synthase